MVVTHLVMRLRHKGHVSLRNSFDSSDCKLLKAAICWSICYCFSSVQLSRRLAFLTLGFVLIALLQDSRLLMLSGTVRNFI